MNKFCCQNWKALVPGIVEQKLSELEKVEPAYLAVPVQEMLHKIDNFCPICGEPLKENLTPPRIKKKLEQTLPRTKASRKCGHCKGLGTLGEDENGIETKCQYCLGAGKLDNSNDGIFPNNPKKIVSPDIINKTAELRTKKVKNEKSSK